MHPVSETTLRVKTPSSPPAITAWTRLEPQPRDATLARSLQAQVRDAAWLLARQWQVGEFAGEDAGSPIEAALSVTSQSLTQFWPGDDATAAVAFEEALPLEVHAEREPVALRLRSSVQLGLWFERKLRAAGVAAAMIESIRVAFPIAAATLNDVLYDATDGALFRTIASGRVVDGAALYRSAAGVTGAAALPAALTSDATITGVLAAFVAYRKRLYSEPKNVRAWQSEELAYDFGVASVTSAVSVTLESDGFCGGHLDWYDVEATGSPGAIAPASPTVSATTQSFAFLPQHVTFRGMPEPRWWTFESGATDFGALETEPVDLSKMLFMEFALTYGNDWFVFGMPANVGTLSTIDTLVVTDTFGRRTIVRSADQTQVVAGTPTWSMFKISGPASGSPYVFIPPSLGVTEDGTPVESVDFIRDPMGAMAWAVEHDLLGTLDAPVDAYQAYLAGIADAGLSRPLAQPGDPPIYYELESGVPGNWIPMIPVKTAAGGLAYRRGGNASASVLDPGIPFYLTDRIITNIGTVATAGFRRTRGMDGSTYVWFARASRAGAGPGWAGLRFDPLERFDGTAGNP